MLDARLASVKDILLAFVQLDADGELEFYCETREGEAVVKRMRVELSRTRAKLAELGRLPQPFKMRVVSNIPATEILNEKEHIIPGTDKVILRKVVGADDAATQQVNELFNAMNMGKMIDVG